MSENTGGFDSDVANIEELESLEQQIEQTEEASVIKLDYTLETPEERRDLVARIIEQMGEDNITNRYLEIMTDYIIFAMDKKEKQEKRILTENRMVTVNNRETSFQGLVDRLENGEDGIYNMIANDKGIIYSPNAEITQSDIDSIPPLKELVAAIEVMKAKVEAATGKQKYSLKKNLIDMYKDQYVIRGAYKPIKYATNIIKSVNRLDLGEKITIQEDGNVISTGQINLFNAAHVSVLLCNYVRIKEDCWGNFESDTYYLMSDLEDLVDGALKEKYPVYYDLLTHKIDGLKNVEIQALLERDHGVKHSPEYLSALWRNKIPKLVADYAAEQYLEWFYNTKVEDVDNHWKTCSRCGNQKVKHTRFFSKNPTSKDGLYSICKECRRKK